MTSLLRYDAACKAVADAKSMDEVRDWLDKAAAVREYARRAKNRKLEIDAIEIRVRARRRRGEMLLEMKQDGRLAEGRKKTVTDDGQLPPLTLEQLDTSRNESSEDQKIAKISEQAFEAMLARGRDRLETDASKHSIDLLRAGAPSATMHSRNPVDGDLDYFPTGPWATRALIEIVMRRLAIQRFKSVWEPACGEGHIAEVLAEYFPEVFASDIHGYGYSDVLCDFLADNVETPPVDWIITNPPFSERRGDRTADFAIRACELASVGVAMFVRSQWVSEGVGRYERIFRDRPPTLIAFFSERVPLHEGRWEPDGDTLTAYCWLVWLRDVAPLPPFWIPPGQRKALERPGDRERFVTSPVTKIAHVVCGEQFDPATGEIFEPEFDASSEKPAVPSPMDVLEPIIRDIAETTGLEVDEDAVAATRAYENELVPHPDAPTATVLIRSSFNDSEPDDESSTSLEEPAAVHQSTTPPPAISSDIIEDIPSFLRPGSPDDYRRRA